MLKFISIYLFSVFCVAQANSESQSLRTVPENNSEFEPAFGYGSNSLSMTLTSDKDKIDFTTTNNSFYFLNLGYKNLSASVKIPLKDQENVRIAKGDTKILDYQLGFSFRKNWQIELYYQKYQGYFLKSKTTELINENLSFGHYGSQVIYVFNPDYAASMVRGSAWNQARTAGSWMLGFGYDHFALNGDLTPQTLGTELRGSLDYAQADSVTLRLSYGHNWIWKNWYAGLSGGLGSVLSQIKYKYLDEPKITQDSQLVSNTGFSVGYTWNKSKVGLFGRGYLWSLQFDDKKLSSSSSLSGFFYSSVF